jgi:hypothetical protein
MINSHKMKDIRDGMVSRRNFIRNASAAGLALGLHPVTKLFAGQQEGFSYSSDFIKLQLDTQRPRLLRFSTDSLGQGQLALSPLLNDQGDAGPPYISMISDNSIAYMPKGNEAPAWEFQCAPQRITIQTRWAGGDATPPFPMRFSQKQNHCTVLGAMPEKNRVSFPCLLHLPGMGTFRISCSDPAVTLWYDADRFNNTRKGEPFVALAFSGAGPQHPHITYTLETAAIYPDTPNISKDGRFDGYRKNFINIYQLNPRIQSLANNSASDACAFTIYLYAEMARKTPELAKGLRATDLVRSSLDQYLGGMKAYGQVGYGGGAAWQSKYDSSDSAPSLVIAACYYILDTTDNAWAQKHYDGIKAWADKMIATDTNNDGIIEYGYSGNSGSWTEKDFKRPANWWDTIGFGHDDAYANALAYRACTSLASVARKLGRQSDAATYAAFAARMKQRYYKHFYNPATGLLAGWKSEDGRLHDYCFTFVNSVAICYGLLTQEQGRALMQALLKKMKAVGYTDFRLGLPGNLIPVRPEDYAHHDRRWGYGKDEEGRDGFQIYENGGATACYAYFTIKALYRLGMRREAEHILLPMLESFKEGGFEGACPGSTMTRDWKAWNGDCWGYEGFLVDNYLTLLAVTDYGKKM